MGQYHHPGLAEREGIMMMRRERMGVREIARAIGRDKSTVSRELARNSSPTGAAPYYGASTVRRKSERRRARCRRPRLTGDPERRALVVSKVRDDRWSPEQVEGRIRAERPELVVGDSTTCRAVASGSLDCELPGHRRMSPCDGTAVSGATAGGRRSAGARPRSRTSSRSALPRRRAARGRATGRATRSRGAGAPPAS